MINFALQGEVFKSGFKPSIEELAAIGISACNTHWFDTCIQWLTAAQKVKTENMTQTKKYIKSIGVHRGVRHDFSQCEIGFFPKKVVSILNYGKSLMGKKGQDFLHVRKNHTTFKAYEGLSNIK